MVQSGTKLDFNGDLYAVSVSELEDRLQLLRAEIVRIEAELLKKQKDLSAADLLFAPKS